MGANEHDKLDRILEKASALESRMAVVESKVSENLKWHEARITKLETDNEESKKFKWKALGILAAIVFIAQTVGPALAHKFLGSH